MSDEDKLVEYGFDPSIVKRALEATGNAGLQDALDWLAENQDSTDKNDNNGSNNSNDSSNSNSNNDNKNNNNDSNNSNDSNNKNEKDSIVIDNDETRSALKCNECEKTFASVTMAQFHAAKSGHQDFSESSEQHQIQTFTPEQKSQKLAELLEKLAEKRRVDQLKSEAEAREAEILRRKSGSIAAQARRELQEKEMIKAAEQLRKDREEAKMIRARIRADIEEERRIKREGGGEQGKHFPQPPSALNDPIKLIPQESDLVRIQVKLSGGENLRVTFKSTELLSKLLDKLSEKVTITSQSKLFIPFPQRTINLESDSSKTFMELGFCPSVSLFFQ